MLDWADSLENQRNLDETLRLCLDAAARGEAEGYRCLFEANLGCRNSTGLDRADLLALAERQMAEATAASDDREYRRHLRCKALWQQQPPSLDAQHWFDEGFKARDPSVVVNKLLGPSACNSGLGLEQRRAMVAEAWLKGDLEAATQIESHALDVEGDQGAGTPPTFDPAMTAHTAICKDKPSSSCIAYLRRLGELCAPPLCIAQGSLLDRIQTFFSPAIAEEARQYSERLRDHLHRGDTQWPALQRVLQSMRDC